MWLEIRAFIAGVVFASAVWGAWNSYVNATHMRWLAEQAEARIQTLRDIVATNRPRED